MSVYKINDPSIYFRLILTYNVFSPLSSFLLPRNQRIFFYECLNFQNVLKEAIQRCAQVFRNPQFLYIFQARQEIDSGGGLVGEEEELVLDTVLNRELLEDGGDM